MLYTGQGHQMTEKSGTNKTLLEEHLSEWKTQTFTVTVGLDP